MRKIALCLSIVFFGLVIIAIKPKAVLAATFTVNSDNDVNDGVCDTSHCSLREAINAANSTPGTDTISFNIPGSGFHSIHLGSALPEITSPVIIDGTIQPGFAGTPIIELDGSGAGEGANGLNITIGNSTIRGLVINRFGGTTSGNGIRLASGDNNVIEGNFIGTDATGTIDLGNYSFGVLVDGSSDNNRIGGPAIDQRNVISGNGARGVEIAGNSTGNLVQGNLIGTDATGSFALSNSAGVRIIDASGNTIGGSTSSARNVISGNMFQGVLIGSAGATGNLVQGNLIGTDITGTQALPNSNDGILINGGAFGNTIGGTFPGEGNVISGNGQRGLQITDGGGNNNIVKGNFIGTANDGVNPLGNAGIGVLIQNSASNNTIGGTESGAQNVIAFNNSDGVIMVSGTGNQLAPNAIFSNNGLGIDLGSNGVTANDVGDADVGANNLQNYPVLASAKTGLGSTKIIGSLNSSSNSTYRVDFFSNPSCDGSGFGEGKSYIGSQSVTTDGSGNVNFTATFSFNLSAGSFITATATDSANNTSEFSGCIQVQTQTPAEAIQDLIDRVQEMNLQQGVENSLDAKLSNAQQALTDLNQNNDAAAINALQAFINEVEAQRGVKITDAQADELVASAQAVINFLSS